MQMGPIGHLHCVQVTFKPYFDPCTPIPCSPPHSTLPNSIPFHPTPIPCSPPPTPPMLTTQDIGWSNQTGVAHTCAELFCTLYIHQLLPLGLLHSYVVEKTRKLEPVLCAVNHVRACSQDWNLEWERKKCDSRLDD